MQIPTTEVNIDTKIPNGIKININLMAYVIDVIGEKASNILKDQETRKFPMHPTVPRKMI